MHKNKQLFILGEKIFIDQKYAQKVKLKNGTKFIFLNFSCKKLNVVFNFKIKYHRYLFVISR
jgi:ABC-type tungstate transport system permease subunit